MWNLFLDESGDHNLKNVDPQQPIFCLAGVIMSDDEHLFKIQQLNNIKMKYFGTTDIIFRSYEIRKRRQEFKIFNDKGLLQQFYSDMAEVLGSGYRLICCCVEKIKYNKKYGITARNPYDISLIILLERLGYFLKQGKVSKICITAESRGKKEDRQLYEAFEKAMSGKDEYAYKSDFYRKDISLCFKRKALNIVGLQIADLIAYPLMMTCKKRKDHTTYKIIKPNFLYNAPRYNFKIVP